MQSKLWRGSGTRFFRGETADDGECTLLLKWQNISSHFADKLQVLLLPSKLLKWTVLVPACITGKIHMFWLAIQKAHALKGQWLKANMVNLKDKCALCIEYIFLKAVLLVVLRNAQVPSPVKYSKSPQQLALKAFTCCPESRIGEKSGFHQARQSLQLWKCTVDELACLQFKGMQWSTQQPVLSNTF